MTQHLKNFLAEIKRIYFIWFEKRPIVSIQEDYHTNKWISKSELYILMEYEKTQLLEIYKNKEAELNDLLKSYNLNAYSNYAALERKFQGKLKIK